MCTRLQTSTHNPSVEKSKSFTQCVAVAPKRQAKELVSPTHCSKYTQNMCTTSQRMMQKDVGSAVGQHRRVNCGNKLENGVIFYRQGRDEPGFHRWAVVESSG